MDYDYDEIQPNGCSWILVALMCLCIHWYLNSDFFMWLHRKKPEPENPYVWRRHLPPKRELPTTQPKERIYVEPDDGPTLLDIEDEVDRNGDDDLEYYDYILK